MTLSRHSPYVIIGAGIHGLSSAYHLAIQLKAMGRSVVPLTPLEEHHSRGELT